MKARALALALLVACELRAVAPPEPAPVVQAAPLQAVPLHAEPARARVVAAAGAMTPALAAGSALAAALPVALASEAALTLALDDDVRIELRGPAQVALHGERGLLARGGLITIDVAAHAVKAGQRAFSLATPAGQLEVPFAARLVLYTSSAGATELASISGEAALSRPDGTLPVGAAARVCLGALGPRALREPGFSTVEAALAALPSSTACAGEQGPELAQLERELTQSLGVFARTKEQERQLLADYTRGDAAPEHAHRLRQELALRAELAIATRRRALALRAQLEAAQLGAARAPDRAALLMRARELESPAR